MSNRKKVTKMQRVKGGSGAQGRTDTSAAIQSLGAVQPTRTAHAILRRPEGSLSNLFGAWALSRFLRRKAWKRDATMICRLSDGSLWAASSPQNMGYAMRGLFSGKSRWHFVKAREWRRRAIVSPKVIWLPASGREFTVLCEIDSLWLPRLDEQAECAAIDRLCPAQAMETRQGQGAKLVRCVSMTARAEGCVQHQATTQEDGI